MLEWVASRCYLFPANCEDPRVDRRHLRLGPLDRVLTIASGGCNAFDYLLEGASVTAVDTNQRQVHLCELKMAVCKTQPHAFAVEVLGAGRTELLGDVYESDLRRLLSAGARRYWDSRVHSMRAPLVYTGASGWLVWFLFRVLGEAAIRKNPSWVDWFVPMFAPFAGVPRKQLDRGKHRGGHGRALVRRLFSRDTPDNYFLEAYRTGSYSVSARPRYLEPDRYAALQAALRAGRMRVACCSLLDAVRVAPAGSFTAACLCDHPDWLTEEETAEEFRVLRARLVGGGRVFWRSFGERLPGRGALDGFAVTECDTSDDRMPLYWGTWVATARAGV